MSYFRQACSIVLVAFLLNTNSLSAEEQQSWSVQFENEKTAIIRATSQTPTKYIKAAIEALQVEGVEKFALKTLKSAEFNQLQNVAMIVKVVENDAELLLAPDLAHKYVISTIKHLNEVGINEVKLTLYEME